MKDYWEIVFEVMDRDQMEILIAMLANEGFEGFEEGDEFLKAYIPEQELNEEELNNISNSLGVLFSKSKIKNQNWNSLWEKNFDPVVINEFVAIRAEFHEPSLNVEHEIIITPKMSFGTGHHATTYMMMQAMLKLSFQHKTIVDFGTGSGILSILAKKLEAGNITALDNDDWSIANAKENFERNGIEQIELIQADSYPVNLNAEIVLANINKNVILENLPTMSNSLKKGGFLIISGFLKDDENQIVTNASLCALKKIDALEKNNWLCMTLTK